MKKLLVFLLCCGAAYAQGQTITPAQPKPFAIAAGTQMMPASKSLLLRLSVQDAKPKSGVCTYYVRSLQYLEAVSILNVEVYQELCLNDAYGFSRGEVLWTVPSRLQAKGAQVSVLINNTKAGVLLFDENVKSFVVKGD